MPGAGHNGAPQNGTPPVWQASPASFVGQQSPVTPQAPAQVNSKRLVFPQYCLNASDLMVDSKLGLRHDTGIHSTGNDAVIVLWQRSDKFSNSHHTVVLFEVQHPELFCICRICPTAPVFP